MVRIGHDVLEERRFAPPGRSRLGLEVLTLGELRRRLSPEALVAPHRLDFHQLTLVTRGRGHAVVDFTEHPCRAGTLLHTRPGQVQRLPRGDDGSPPPDAVIVLFTRSFVARPGLTTGLGTDAWQLAPEARRRLRVLITELGIEHRSAGVHDDSPQLLRHLLAALLIHVARLPRPAASGDPGGTAGIARFLDDLEHHFRTTRRVQDYAARLGYSPRTLTRMSLAATGTTAKDVIDARVTLEAKRLLAHTDRPVAAIAHELGFSEATNFVKFFSSRQGATPAAFRHAEQRG